MDFIVKIYSDDLLLTGEFCFTNEQIFILHSVCNSQVSSKKQDLKHSQQCPLERRSLLSRLYVEKRTTESNNSGCFDIVFG
ncbi:hypothetical protein KP509_33G047200 [Ceratopteris richardii]|uniref:Uncharacterized protein n=1 Tax=Ceratopteris richardii TaxID=49495 RepID=A0A8T2QQD9_CERRI|nr:hypothetical protein KP509_33G047200 [Ceratopteris richardii]